MGSEFSRGAVLVVGVTFGVGGTLLVLRVVQHGPWPSNKTKNRGREMKQSHQRPRRQQQPENGPLPRITDVEERYFIGISHLANLTEGQFQHLRDFVKRDQRDDEVENCGNLLQLLGVLRRRGTIKPCSYHLLLNIFSNAGLDGVSDCVRLGVHIERLENACRDIDDGYVPRDYEADQFELDALILHTDNDRLAAFRFKQHLEEDCNISDMQVMTYEEYSPYTTAMGALATVFQRTRFIFVLVTHSLTNDNLTRFLNEIALTDGLTNPAKNERIVPVWTTQERVTIPELNILKGVKYWDYLNEPQMKQIYINSMKNLISHGREHIHRA